VDERKPAPERNPVADAVSTIAWALVILHLDFNVWRLNILGNWVGSGLAIKKGAKFVRPVMIFVLCLLLVKIVYDFFATAL